MTDEEIEESNAKCRREALSHEVGCRCWYCLCTWAGAEAAHERDAIHGKALGQQVARGIEAIEQAGGKDVLNQEIEGDGK